MPGASSKLPITSLTLDELDRADLGQRFRAGLSVDKKRRISGFEIVGYPIIECGPETSAGTRGSGPRECFSKVKAAPFPRQIELDPEDETGGKVEPCP